MQQPTLQHLERLAEEYALMLDHLPVHVWFLTDVETYGRVNQLHANFLGRAKQEVECKKIDTFLSPEAARFCRSSNEEVFRRKEAVQSEEWLENSEGEKRLLAITKTPKLSADGEIAHIFCAGIDITERRQENQRLLLSEKNFRSFIETMDDLVLIGDLSGKIIYANIAVTAKLGFSRSELYSMQIIDLHPPWVRQEAGEIVQQMFQGQRETCPLPLAAKGGSILPVETRAWLGKWNGENCMFGLCKDLSSEQDALQKFDKIFRLNPALMALSSLPDRCFVDVNEAFLRTLGYERDEVIGRTSVQLGLFSHNEEHERVSQLLARYGCIREVELQVRAKSGEIRTGLFSGDVIESQGQRYFLTVMVDISDRKQAEAEREKTIQELQSAMEQLKTLRGIIPICCNCKRIRDDKGYWDQVEAYVSRHTEARFSHGICPECKKKLYPQYSRESRQESGGE